MSSRHIRSQNIANSSPITTYTGYLYYTGGTTYTTSFEHSCVCYNINRNNNNALPRIEIAYESFQTGAIVSVTSGIITQQDQLNTSSSSFTPTQSGWYRIRIYLSRQSNTGTAAVALDNFTSTVPVSSTWNDTTVPMDQQISISASETIVQDGDMVVFTIEYSLNSFLWYTRVKGAEFMVDLPPGFQYQSHAISGWNYDAAQTSYNQVNGLFRVHTSNVPPFIQLTITTIAQNVQPGNFATVYSSNLQPQNQASASVNPSPISIIPSSTQPVELILWEGKAEKKGNLLRWATAMELNNDTFIIERSKDGKVFYPIAFIDGAGDHSGRLDYSFIDNTAYSGTTYYRLSQVDFDGSRKTFEILRVVREHEHQEIQILQNPGSPTRIVIQVPQDDWQFQLYTKAGKLIHQGYIPASEIHSNTMEINGLNLSPELHILTLQSKNQNWSGKLLVRRD